MWSLGWAEILLRAVKVYRRLRWHPCLSPGCCKIICAWTASARGEHLLRAGLKCRSSVGPRACLWALGVFPSSDSFIVQSRNGKLLWNHQGLGKINSYTSALAEPPSWTFLRLVLFQNAENTTLVCSIGLEMPSLLGCGEMMWFCNAPCCFCALQGKEGSSAGPVPCISSCRNIIF